MQNVKYSMMGPFKKACTRYSSLWADDIYGKSIFKGLKVTTNSFKECWKDLERLKTTFTRVANFEERKSEIKERLGLAMVNVGG